MCHAEFGDQEKVFICQLDLIYHYHDNAVGTASPELISLLLCTSVISRNTFCVVGKKKSS